MIKNSILGSSLLEVLIAIALCSMMLVGSGAALLTSKQTALALSDLELIQRHAKNIIGRVSHQRFGSLGGPPPLKETVDNILGVNGPVSNLSLCQLHEAQPYGIWTWQDPQLGLQGQWKLEVSNDLNNDGEIDDPIEQSMSVFRITISFDNRPILETIRTDESL